MERLAESGIAPHAVYVVAPVFGPGHRSYDLSPEEGAASHRIEITEVAGRKLAALACHASQTDVAEEIAELRAALDREGAVYEGSRVSARGARRPPGRSSRGSGSERGPTEQARPIVIRASEGAVAPGPPTPGMDRRQIIDLANVWVGWVRTDAGLAGGWHHHGDP